MSYSKYEHYKSSNIDWLGDIPAHWEVSKIKWLTPVRRGASPRPIDDLRYFDDNGEFAWVRISDVTASEKYLEVTKEKLSKLGASYSVKMSPGDIFLSIAGSVGKAIITKIKCCIHDGFVYFPQLPFRKEYLYYIFLSEQPYQGLGKMGTQLNLNTETVGSIKIPFPPAHEIDAIAAYLDHKLADIDTFIAKKQRLITLLQEQKAAMINKAVTKGLNENEDAGCNFRASGVDWIGDIPTHWEVKKLKYIAKTVLGKMLCNTPIDGFYKKPYLKSKNIQWLRVDTADVEEMYFSEKELTQFKLHKGDLILSEGGEVGKTCIWNDELPECYIQNSAHKVTFNAAHNSRYFLYQFFYAGKIGLFDSIVNRVSIAHLTQEKLRAIKFIVPPLTEQIAIVSHIEAESARIDKAISLIERELTLVQEYRTALIAEAVTGKIKCPDVEQGQSIPS